MNTYKNKEVKKYIAIFTCISILLILAAFLFTRYELGQIKETQNESIAALISIIQRDYPKADTQAIIRELNSETPDSNARDLLLHYGISRKYYAIQATEGLVWRVITANILLVAVACLTLFLTAHFYLKKRHRKLNELTSYMSNISNGNYTLALEENAEDELSSLKNELYKISLSLKEHARLSNNQHAALAASVSDISHQLKTPLTSISVLLDNLIDAENMDEETRHTFLMEISRQLSSINWLIVSMLKLSRLDAGVVEFENKPIRLSQLFNEIDDNLDVLAELKNIHFEWQLKGDIVFMGDYNWNREAITNIVKNALEHSPINSTVTITASSNDVYTKITVKDTGSGISPEDQKHIFERYYLSSSSLPESNGIGLPLAKTIIEKQNGYLSVESDSHGTIFTIKYLKFII